MAIWNITRVRHTIYNEKTVDAGITKTIKPYHMTPRFFLFALLTIFLVIIAVMGWHWSDLANTPFWWNFWVIASIASIVTLVVMWVIAWTGQNKRK